MAFFFEPLSRVEKNINGFSSPTTHPLMHPTRNHPRVSPSSFIFPPSPFLRTSCSEEEEDLGGFETWEKKEKWHSKSSFFFLFRKPKGKYKKQQQGNPSNLLCSDRASGINGAKNE